MEVYSENNGNFLDGCVVCLECSTWHRTEKGIVDMLPIDIKQSSFERFILRDEKFAVRHGLPMYQKKSESGAQTENSKTKLIGAFEDVVDYEKRVVNNSYYKALDQIAFYDWMNRNLSSQDFVLDIGCGTARQCIPLAERQIRTIGIDIDEDMLIEASRKLEAKSLHDVVDLVVADGANSPLKSECFSACVLYGVLHHLADKKLAIQNASSKLTSGGKIYALDPHKSVVRFVFDLIMRVWDLCIEEASDDPLITESQLEEWMKEAQMFGNVKFSTYVPPHVFLGNLQKNIWLLETTDRIINNVPWLRKFAGAIIFEGRKTEIIFDFNSNPSCILDSLC